MPELEDMDRHGNKAILARCVKKVYSLMITFVCLLSACTHTHLMDEGQHCFYLMSTVYMIPAKLVHCTCIVDLLGHAGHLQDVEIMIKEMPCNQMLFCGGFCSVLAELIHDNVEMGERIAKRVLELELENATGF